MVIHVRAADTLVPRDDTIRAIQVPFAIPPRSTLRVAVTGCERQVPIPPGEYALTFEHGLCEDPEKMWCVFTFVPDPAAEPAILIADSELSPPTPLLMEADPAY